uniref:Putative secreted protein n=1 Tax=Anopheles marajoara TaxID=58244 RepID=A0A2M4CBP2_9DIPT
MIYSILFIYTTFTISSSAVAVPIPPIPLPYQISSGSARLERNVTDNRSVGQTPPAAALDSFPISLHTVAPSSRAEGGRK